MTPVEDVAATIAEKVRANGWSVDRNGDDIWFYPNAESGEHFCTLYCKDASQAKRLAEMMGERA